MRQGQFQVYSQGKTKESWDIISNDEYRLEARKTWIQRTQQWHIEFIHYDSDQFPHRCEMFLTKEEIARLKEIL
jgi:outer membrane biogenesis lipoprotein LolB